MQTLTAQLAGSINLEAEIKQYALLAEKLKPFVIDSAVFVHRAIASGKRVLAEGANALMLDLDFGTYPYVTSSSTGIGKVNWRPFYPFYISF